MIDNNQKHIFLQKVLSSSPFQSSQINKDLLQYLYDKSIHSVTPREIDIATDLLNPGKSFDPTPDTLVRSRVYKLRQKLSAYYQSEGITDEYRLELPKGSYRLEFIKRSHQKKSQKKLIIGILVLVLVLSLLMNGYYFLERTNRKPNHYQIAGNHPFWSGFIHNSAPSLFVVGDFFTFIEYTPDDSTERVIRDYDINSIKDFEAYLRQHPRVNASVNDNYRSIAWTAVENVLKVSALYYTNDATLLTKRASQLSWEDVRNSNVIFEGHPRSLFILNRILKMTNLDISKEVPFDVYVTANHTDTVQVYRSNYTADVMSCYVVVAKLPGPSENVVFLCVTHDEMPRTYIMEQLTHIDFLQELDATLMAELGEIPVYFEMVLRIEGFPRTGFKHEIVYVNQAPISDQAAVSFMP